MGKCVKCGKDSEARRLADSVCSICVKTKAKTVVDTPTSNFLNADNLSYLSEQRKLIQPDDSISMAGAKRLYFTMEEEYESP